MKKNKTLLRIAIQKSGRLSTETKDFLKACGISYHQDTAKLRGYATNFPLELLYLRDDDIPECLADGVADIGIIGENLIFDQDKDITILERLNFARCRLSIALPKRTDYKGTQDLNGLNIATSYTNSLKKFLTEKNIAAEAVYISGSAEIAPGIGLADAVCDIVSSGSTLASNGLKEVETVFSSEAVLAQGTAHGEALEPEKQAILEQLLFRIRAVCEAKANQYIMLNAPNEAIEKIVELLPGATSPTVVPLARESWSSIHSVIKKEGFWEMTAQLKNAGAEAILVLPIEKMIK